MRVVGLDIHRNFAEAALIDVGCVRHPGGIDLGSPSPKRSKE